MKNHHVYISGTGRSGTTFLTYLLTMLGFDTGVSPANAHQYLDYVYKAGLEHPYDAKPYIIKSPGLCTHIKEVIARDDIAIDFVIIPIRELKNAALSREHQQKINNTSDPVAGGYWCASDLKSQESALAINFYELVYNCQVNMIPYLFLEYPRFVLDPSYTFHQVISVLGNVDYEHFLRVFKRCSKPDLVHDYEAVV